MQYSELIKARYSVRKYDSRHVEQEKLDEILKAAQVAPTAVNFQPVRVTVVNTSAGLEKISKGANIYGSPLAFIISADRETAWVRDYDGKNHAEIDATIVTDHMMLAATELGLGTVWICKFDPEIIRTEFKIAENLEPVNILAVGYPAADCEPSPRHFKRKDISEFVTYAE